MTKSRILYTAMGLLALLVLASSFKRVPLGHVGLRVSSNGAMDSYEPVIHLIMPAPKDFLLFPRGQVDLRYPASGSVTLTMKGDKRRRVALDLSLGLDEGSARNLYQRYSSGFEKSLEKAVRRVSTELAQKFSSYGDKYIFADRLTVSLNEELTPLGVTVAYCEIPVWEDLDAAEARERDAVADSPPCKLILLGFDSADWRIIRPMVLDGDLPHFARLMEQGSTAPFRSMVPLLSPLLWTTMATGKPPEEHGILTFSAPNPQTGRSSPISRYYRRVDAFWNFLSDYGRSVVVVGWFATFPAEQVNGVLVSDRLGSLANAPVEGFRIPRGTVFPPERSDEILDLVEHAEEISFEECSRYIHLDRDEFEALRFAGRGLKNPVQSFNKLYAATHTVANVALHFLDQDQPDVLVAYFSWLDSMSHLFMRFAPPQLPEVSDEQYERYKDAIRQTYIEQDRILGRFMERMDDDTVIMVLSDHGFKYGDTRMRTSRKAWVDNPGEWHRSRGVLALMGKGIKQGVVFQGASIMDVAPEVLALMGLPRADDMKGHHWESPMEPDLLQLLNERSLPTLQKERPQEKPTWQAPTAAELAADQSAMDMLETLGYLTSGNVTEHNSLGQRYQRNGDYEAAMREYQAALDLNPESTAAYNNLATCLMKLRRYEEAESALQKAIGLKPDNYYALGNLALLRIQAGDLQDARVLAQKAIRADPSYAQAHLALGVVFSMTGNLEQARQEFQEVLRYVPGDPAAKANLEQLEQLAAAGRVTP